MSTPSTVVLSFALAMGACAKTKASGTAPSDMTAEQHRQACLDHKGSAAAYDRRAKDLDGGKGTNSANVAAAEQTDVANQHGAAAKQVDPSVECD